MCTTLVHNFCSKLLPTAFVHAFCSQLLITIYGQNFCLQLLFTIFAHNFYSHFLMMAFLFKSSSQLLNKTFLFTTNFAFNFFQSFFLFTTFVQNLCLQLLFANIVQLRTHVHNSFTTHVHNSCLQLMFTSLLKTLSTTFDHNLLKTFVHNFHSQLLFTINFLHFFFSKRICYGMSWNIKKSLRNHRKNIPTITIFVCFLDAYASLGPTLSLTHSLSNSLTNKDGICTIVALLSLHYLCIIFALTLH